MKFDSEVDVAKSVTTWLGHYHWEVYQEVATGRGGCFADIVAKRGPLVWIIEVKQRFNMSVMAQAYQWRHRGAAHLVSVATPDIRVGSAQQFVRFTLKNAGIGWLRVQGDGNDGYSINEIMMPRFTRRLDSFNDIRKWLLEDHKTFLAAGTASGARFTPWQATCRSIRKIVEQNPGIGLKELIEKISHHYDNNTAAYSSLSQWLRKGVIKGVETRKEAGRVKVYLAPNSGTT